MSWVWRCGTACSLSERSSGVSRPHWWWCIWGRGLCPVPGIFFYILGVMILCFGAFWILLVGRVALGAQRPIVIKLSRGRSVGLCVRLSSALWKNGGSDSDAVWHLGSDGSRDEADSGVWGSVHGKGYFWGEFGARHCNQWKFYGVHVRQRRDAALFPNYFGQTCFSVAVMRKGAVSTPGPQN